MDQLACFPLPLISWKGFSFSRTVYPYLSKASFKIYMVIKLWKIDLPAYSYIVQN